MERIKTIIIDDEVASTEVFAIELEMYCPNVEIVASCNSANAGLESIARLKPDLVFLDIEMPWMNGFELLQQFAVIDFEVVFVTAYDDFAIKAFKYSAADYLLKPVKPQELMAAVEAVGQRLHARAKTEHIEALLSNINFLQLNIPKIAFPTFEGVEFVNLTDIIYCEADGSYAYIHLVEGRKILQSKSLKQVEAMLEGQHFLRIHQSYLINLRHIKRYHRGSGGSLTLSNELELPVSRARKDDLLDHFSR